MEKLNTLRRWQIAITLLTSFSYFFYYFGRYSYAATIPFIKEEWGLTNTAVGMMATVLTLGYAIGQFVNGFLIDKYGPRLMLFLGGVLSTFANLGVSIATTFTGVLTFWGLNGYVQAFGYGSCCKLYSNWFPPEGRGKPLGFNESLQSFSSMIIVPLAALIIVKMGWRWVYVIPVIPLFVSSLVFYWLIANEPNEVGLGRKWITSRDIQADIHKPNWRDAYRMALSDWRMIASYVSYGGSQFARFAIYTWVPAFIFAMTGNIITGGLVTAAFALGGAFGSLAVGWISDILKKRSPVIFVGMVISGLSLLLFAMAPSAPLWFLSLVMAICGTGIEAVEVCYFLLPMDILDNAGYHATGVGTMNAFGKFFATFQGVVLGALLDASGYQTAFIVVGLVSLASAFLVLPIRK